MPLYDVAASKLKRISSELIDLQKIERRFAYASRRFFFGAICPKSSHLTDLSAFALRCGHLAC